MGLMFRVFFRVSNVKEVILDPGQSMCILKLFY